MLEWDSYTRHWWRYDGAHLAMRHRASGEAIVYRGPMLESGWHRFDYEHTDGQYPLAVQIKKVEYPNPFPDAYIGPPSRSGRIYTLRPWVWSVDHVRSALLWSQEHVSPEPPPYWLWHRADIAITDAGLLWPQNTPVGHCAEEVAISGGWYNGQWQPQFYRRMSWILEQVTILQSARRGGNAFFALPLTDHQLTELNKRPPEWNCIAQEGIDGYGRRVDTIVSVMRNVHEGMTIGRAVDARDYHDISRKSALVTIGSGFWFTAPLSSCDRIGSASYDDGATRPVWQTSLGTSCAIGLAEGPSDWLRVGAKPVMHRDAYFAKPTKGWQYDPSIIDHAIASYGLWRLIYEAHVNALPSCSGFYAGACDSPTHFGDVGTLYVGGGFVGGIQGLKTAVRLRLRLPNDDRDFSWERFF